MNRGSDITQNDDKILENLLATAEYAYRLGVYHGSLSKDIAEIEEATEIPLSSKKYKILRDAPQKLLSIDKFRDVVVMWCGQINAMYLRNLLRADSKIFLLRTAMLNIIYEYYKDGLKIGIQYDRVSGKEFFDTVYRGLVHIDAKTKKRRSKETFFDEMKYKANVMHEKMQEAKVKSGMNSLSVFMGNTWLKYMIK